MSSSAATTVTWLPAVCSFLLTVAGRWMTNKNINYGMDITLICFFQEKGNGDTALILACMKGHSAVAKLLVDEGADVNYMTKVENIITWSNPITIILLL